MTAVLNIVGSSTGSAIAAIFMQIIEIELLM